MSWAGVLDCGGRLVEIPTDTRRCSSGSDGMPCDFLSLDFIRPSTECILLLVPSFLALVVIKVVDLHFLPGERRPRRHWISVDFEWWSTHCFSEDFRFGLS